MACLWDDLPEGIEVEAHVHDEIVVTVPADKVDEFVEKAMAAKKIGKIESLSLNAAPSKDWPKVEGFTVIAPEGVFTGSLTGNTITVDPVQNGTWPILYTKGKKGELRCWQVSALGNKVIVKHGVVGGAEARSERTCKPKNVGRANATTPEQQALKEAAADYKFQLDRKYSLTPEDAQETVPLPMLAKDFKKQKKIQYPVDVQRKLDGVRAIARWDGEKVVLISRGGLIWERVPHLNKALESILPRESEFDGEIYLHGKTFQQQTQIIKNLEHPDNPNLTYQVYDMPTIYGHDQEIWSYRKNALSDTLGKLSLHGPDFPVKLVETIHSVKDAAAVQQLHDEFVKEGYEGAIVRILAGLYEYGYRSDNLLKLKAFDDSEFIVTGFKESENEPGLIKWVCQNDINDLTFDTRPRGTHADRRWLLQNGDKFVGQKLTVIYFGRYDTGLPRFPIGKAIRPDEDL